MVPGDLVRGLLRVLTIRLLARIILWIARVMTPIPQPVGAESRYRGRPTGLAIPVLDVLVVTFGVVVLVNYFA